MQNFRVRMKEITDPYMISKPAGALLPLYDYGVCGVLEDFLNEYMEEGEFSAAFSYLDFICDGVSVQGCMTLTIVQFDFCPEVFTFLYEKELNTCG